MFEIPMSKNLCLSHGVLALALALLAGCSSVSRTPVQRALAGEPSNQAPTVQKSALTLPAFNTWQHYQLPGKQPTAFSFTRFDGRDAVMANAESSASMLRHRIRIEPGDLGQIGFSWQVPQLIASADMALIETDDSPVRIVLAFEGDRSRFSLKNAMLSELSHAITGEPLPYATLMYVWCNKGPTETVIVNPRTDRIREMVVESGTQGLNRWRFYKRNIRADFEQAFGESPGALVGIGIMTDSDNTRSNTHAWYGPLDLAPVP